MTSAGRSAAWAQCSITLVVARMPDHQLPGMSEKGSISVKSHTIGIDCREYVLRVLSRVMSHEQNDEL